MKRMSGRMSLALTRLTLARRALLICAVLSLAMVAAGGSTAAKPPTLVSLTEADKLIAATPTQAFAAGVFKGTVGTEPVSGRTFMAARIDGNTFHCVHMWVTAAGSTLILRSDCDAMTMKGEWRVVDGDGIFASFQAQGSLTMDLDGFDLDGVHYDTAEFLTGSVD
jgi:hypothetical protein